MTRHMTIAALVVLTVVVLTCATAGSALAQPPGRGGPGGPPADGGGPGAGGNMMYDLMYLERSWTAVCFQLLCSTEQLNALLAPFDEALQTRDAAIQAALEAQDMEAVTDALSTCKKSVDAALQEHLTEEQWAKHQELMDYHALGTGPGPR